MDEDLVWKIKFFIYQHCVSTTRPPEAKETASHFHISLGGAEAVYQELHRRDAIYLEPGTSRIRMAFPFSAVPTSFRVQARGKSYWANCAWDSLGIPAALHSDAEIETTCAGTRLPISLAVRDGQLLQHGERVHFLLPFLRWYNDLSYT
jgi:hypothetical protein